MSNALVSVIIPTHGRARYAVSTIRSLLALSQEIEVVVCDTSEVDEISSALTSEPAAGRLKIVRPNRPMSVVDNFNEALGAASGQYLVFIGDDDFVSTEIVNVARWALAQGVDALKFSFPALYYWPDFKHQTQADAFAGTLRISAFDGSVRRHDALSAVEDALQNLGGGVLEMPRAYAGMVSASLVSTIEKKHGLLFGGVSPDIYSALLISLEAKNCIKIDFPVIVPGASGASTAGQSANGKHAGGLRENAHIGAFRNLIWDVRIPEFYSVPTVWSYSLVKAVERAGLSEPKVNFSRLYVKCMLYQRKYQHQTLSAVRTYGASCGWGGLVAGMVPSVAREVIWIATKVWQRLLIRISPAAVSHVQGDLGNTASASAAMEEYIARNHCKIEYPLRLPL